MIESKKQQQLLLLRHLVYSLDNDLHLGSARLGSWTAAHIKAHSEKKTAAHTKAHS